MTDKKDLFNDGVNERIVPFRSFYSISLNLKSRVANVVVGRNLIALVEDSAQ